MLLAHLLLLVPYEKIRLNEKRLDERTCHLGVKLRHAHEQLVPVALILDGVRERLALRGEQGLGQEGVELIHDLAMFSSGFSRR